MGRADDPDDGLDADEVPVLDREDEALVARVRALPPEGHEPDWRRLEATIRAKLSEHAMPVPWWRSWRYLVPLSALAVTAGIALVVVTRGDPPPSRTSMVTAPRDAGVTSEPPAADRANALWLDGEAVELDDVEPAALDDDAVDPMAGEDDTGIDDDDGGGILPIVDYGWVDTLDDDAIARAESWLARKRS